MFNLMRGWTQTRCPPPTAQTSETAQFEQTSTTSVSSLQSVSNLSRGSCIQCRDCWLIVWYLLLSIRYHLLVRTSYLLRLVSPVSGLMRRQRAGLCLAVVSCGKEVVHQWDIGIKTHHCMEEPAYSRYLNKGEIVSQEVSLLWEWMNILVFGEGGFVAGDLCELPPLLSERLNPRLLHTASRSGYTLQLHFSAAKTHTNV